MDNEELQKVRRVLGELSWELKKIAFSAAALNQETHLSAEDIAAILDTRDHESLEIITDSADDALIRIEHASVEMRLKISTFLEGLRK